MLLFLLSIGLSVVFGMMNFINLAHGTLYMVGAYLALSTVRWFDSYWVALIARSAGRRAHRRGVLRGAAPAHAAPEPDAPGAGDLRAHLRRLRRGAHDLGGAAAHDPDPGGAGRPRERAGRGLSDLPAVHHRGRSRGARRALLRTGTYPARGHRARRRRRSDDGGGARDRRRARVLPRVLPRVLAGRTRRSGVGAGVLDLSRVWTCPSSSSPSSWWWWAARGA